MMKRERERDGRDGREDGRDASERERKNYKRERGVCAYYGLERNVVCGVYVYGVCVCMFVMAEVGILYICVSLTSFPSTYFLFLFSLYLHYTYPYTLYHSSLCLICLNITGTCTVCLSHNN